MKPLILEENLFNDIEQSIKNLETGDSVQNEQKSKVIRAILEMDTKRYSDAVK